MSGASAELSWLAAVIEHVEEYGDDACADHELAPFPPQPTAGAGKDDAERDAIIEACAVAASAIDRTGYEWVRDSLWATVLKRAGDNVRALKGKPLP